MIDKIKLITPFRFALFLFFSAILGIFICYGFEINSYPIIFFCLINFFFVLYYSLLHKKYVFLPFLICIFIIGLIASNYKFILFKSTSIDFTKQYMVIGEINTNINQNSIDNYIVLENCKIYLDDYLIEDGCNINLYIRDSCVQIGDTISFKSTLSKNDLIDNNLVSSFTLSNSKYSVFINGSDIDILDNKLTFKQKFKGAVYEKLSTILDEKSLSVAYTVLFGDKTYLSKTTYDSFKETGFAHILAVSGLHTTIIFTLLAFILLKCKIPRKWSLLALLIIITSYAYICDFSPSVVRASFMCLAISLQYFINRKFDTLNSLGSIGLILLLINPLYLFNVGFLLSFTCIYSLVLLNKVTNNCFKFVKASKLKELLSSSLSIIIGTLPTMALFFGYISLISLFTNLLLLPLFILTFILLAISSILIFIPFISFIFSIIAYIFTAIIDLVLFIASIFPHIATIKITALTVFCFIILLFIIMKMKFKIKTTKPLVSTSLMAIIILTCIYANLPKFHNDNLYKVNENFSCYYTNTSMTSLLFNPFISSNCLYETSKSLEQTNTYKIDNIIITNMKFIKYDMVEEFINEFKVKNIFVLEEFYDKNILFFKHFENFISIHIFQENENFNAGISLSCKQNNEIYYIEFYINDQKFLI